MDANCFVQQRVNIYKNLKPFNRQKNMNRVEHVQKQVTKLQKLQKQWFYF